MKPTIRSSCSECQREVDMAPSDVLLVHGERATYQFICPLCGQLSTKATDKKIVGLLLGAGVQWAPEDEGTPHPERILNNKLPPLTLDDLIDFHNELEKL